MGTRKTNTNNWVTVDDKFLIASCSKAFTATLSAILIEKGYLDWNTTLKEAYPDLNMRSEYEDITLIQLLSHRAGLPEWIYHVSSKNVTDQFNDNWWADRDTPANMRLEYLKETVKENLSGYTEYFHNIFLYKDNHAFAVVAINSKASKLPLSLPFSKSPSTFPI